jgi:hypothetical protein
MRSHYDFFGGERDKYAGCYAEGTNVVVLTLDVPDSVAANDTLRTIERVSRNRIVSSKVTWKDRKI